MSALSDEILAKVDILDIVSKYVSLKKTGANYSALCPFHNEKSPSFVVSPQKQIYKCFGCGEGGNAISFVMNIERLDYRDAVKMLSNQYHIDLKPYMQNPEKHQEYQTQKQKFKRMNKICQQFFLDHLTKSQETQEYIHKRNISDDITKKFGLGYAPASFDALPKYLKQQGFTYQDMEEGSFVKSSGNSFYAFFRDRLTIPIFDHIGNIIAFGARTMDPEGKPKYINTSDTALYDKSKALYGIHTLKEAIKTMPYTIIVEGYPDVLSMHSIGYRTTLATCGTALTKDHLKILKRYTSDVKFLFDADDAGHNATIKATKTAFSIGIFPTIVQLPSGYKDIDEYISATPDAKTKLQGLVENTQDAFTRAWEYFQTKYDLTHIQQKQQLLYEMFALVRSLDDIIAQQSFLERLAQWLSIRYETILTQYKQFCHRAPRERTPPKNQTSKPRKPSFEELAATIIDQELIEKFDLAQEHFIQHFKTFHDHRTEQEEPKTGSQDIILRWEQELQKYPTTKEQIAYIKKLLLPNINTFCMQWYKTAKTAEKKQAMLSLLQKLKT